MLDNSLLSSIILLHCRIFLAASLASTHQMLISLLFITWKVIKMSPDIAKCPMGGKIVPSWEPLHYTATGMAKMKNTVYTKCWQRYEATGILQTVSENVKWLQKLWRITWQFLKVLRLNPPWDPNIHSINRSWHKMNESTCPKTRPWIFIVVLFIIAPNWEQLICLSTGEWINTLWYIHTKEYYTAKKGSGLLIQTTHGLSSE